MKLSKVTVDILKNFSDINTGIVIKKGDTLSSMNIMKTMFAKAVVPDEFPVDFAIYDLIEFLNIYSILGDPEMNFKNDHVVMIDQRSGDEAEYFYSSPSVIVHPENRSVNPPTGEKMFTLTTANLSRIDKISSTAKLKDLKVGTDNLMLYNRNGVGLRAYLNLLITLVEDEEKRKPADSIIKIENLKLLPLDYAVTVGHALAMFRSTTEPYHIDYFIALTSPDEK
jgi:hypothetical protein